MHLSDYQDQFLKLITQGDVETSLFNNDPIPGLTVYRDSIQGHRVAAYEKLFPCCQRLIGKNSWAVLINEFIKSQPSRANDITQSAIELPLFIEAYAATASLAYLADMARLELGWHACFHQASKIQLPDLRDLAAALEQSGENLILYLLPGSQLLSSHFPLLQLWQICQADHLAEEVQLERGRYYFILHRKRDSIIITELNEDAWQLCQLLAQGDTTLVRLCEQMDSKELNNLIATEIISWRNS